MFKNLFKKKEEIKEIAVHSAVTGEFIPLEDVPDPVFSEKMMGDGCAIKPSDEEVFAPVSGEIVQVFPTKHAIGIEAENGAQILVHVGLETVNLNGEGFTVHVEEGDTVNQGDKLLRFDMNVIEDKAASTIIPIIVTNTDEMQEIRPNGAGSVTAGQDDILFFKK
ncbi:PTS sugar transporter subunit IIA [Lentibacillus jeotgali]|uniref:PTS sugar transporter subunit IIA n=1 Tax=Lentibacillus jeotgali TaxID=558169 RepID=UPI0002627054|nr:PTS glucose transporter subunit IIA [Lentibacillus jeotgali]